MRPAVLEKDGFQIKGFLPPREHGPAHVHVCKAGGGVVINLPDATQPLTLRSGSKRMRNADVVAAVRLIEAHVERAGCTGGSTMRNASLREAEILAQIPGARAAQARKHGLRATSARYDRKAERVVLELTNGFLFGFPIRSIPALRTATATQRAVVEVDASGGALRWEALDIELSVPGVLLSAVSPAERRQHLASLVGKSTSVRKAAAARTNGAKGGRPRKQVLVRNAKKATRKVATAGLR